MTFYGMGNQFFGLSKLAKAVMGQKPKKLLFLIKDPPPQNSREILKKTPQSRQRPPQLNNDLSSKTFPVLLGGTLPIASFEQCSILLAVFFQPACRRKSRQESKKAGKHFFLPASRRRQTFFLAGAIPEICEIF